MPPGTKLKITGDVMARNGFLLLTPSVVKILGGHVDQMVDKWKANKVSSNMFLCIQVTVLLEKALTERSKATGNVGDGPPPFIPFKEATSKRQYGAKATEQIRNSSTTAAAAQSPLKHGNQPKQDVKTSAKQTDKPKTHQHQVDRTHETPSHRQPGNKPHYHHQAKHFQQHERFQDKPFQGQHSRQRTHNPKYKQSKGHANDESMRSHAQSDYLPITFNSSEEHFPALSHPTNHPQRSSTAADDKFQPPHKPLLAWDGQPSSTTGGSIPFSAKRKT